MSFFRHYSAVIVLLSSPDVIFSKGVSLIDTELYEASGAKNYVRTKLDFGDAEHIKTFPKQIGVWEGFDYGTSKVAEDLGADVMLLRGYSRPGLYQPIFFLIMQSEDRSTFHPPPVCYSALGYTIEGEGKEEIPLSGVSWAESYEGETSLGSSMPVKKLLVFKESEGKVTERRLALYFYVKQNPINPFASNAITMIRVSALIPIDAPYGGLLDIMKDFTAETIPYMFEPYSEGYGGGERIVTRLGKSGVAGYFGMVALFTVPLALILYPRLKSSRRSDRKS
jgi:hypothetical protein